MVKNNSNIQLEKTLSYPKRILKESLFTFKNGKNKTRSFVSTCPKAIYSLQYQVINSETYLYVPQQTPTHMNPVSLQAVFRCSKSISTSMNCSKFEQGLHLILVLFMEAVIAKWVGMTIYYVKSSSVTLQIVCKPCISQFFLEDFFYFG